MQYYPNELEAWWLAEASKQLKSSKESLTLKRLAAAAEILSCVFTSDREEDFSGYAVDVEAVMAYASYFYPQTFVRIRYVIQELVNFRQWKPVNSERIRILDLGSGLGAASCSLAYYLNTHFQQGVLVDAVDHSRVQLDLLKQCVSSHRSLWPISRWMTHVGDAKEISKELKAKFSSQDSWDVIIASFSLGEFFYGATDDEIVQWIERLLLRLTDGGVLLLLEPALAETALRLERVRDSVVQKGTKVWGPCLHHQNCPILEAHEDKHWCHEVRNWRVPRIVEEINKRMDFPRVVKELKFSYLVLGKEAGHLPHEHLGRMVSPVIETAGKFQMSVCASSGCLEHYDLLTRGFKAKDKKEVRKIHRGDVVQIKSRDALKGKNCFRVASKEHCQITYHHEH